MKKSLIAAGAASLAVAAMPVVGVFAVNNTVTDTLRITVPDSCTLSSSAERDTTNNDYPTTFAEDIANGSYGTITGSAIKVICNDNGNWRMNALTINAAGESGSEVAVLNGLKTSNADYQISSGTYDGAASTSYWGFKLAVTTAGYDATISSGYTGVSSDPAWAAVPAGTAATVATGNKTDNVNGAVITPTYYVRISATQSADTYVGGVKYTLVHPQN